MKYWLYTEAHLKNSTNVFRVWLSTEVQRVMVMASVRKQIYRKGELVWAAGADPVGWGRSDPVPWENILDLSRPFFQPGDCQLSSLMRKLNGSPLSVSQLWTEPFTGYWATSMTVCCCSQLAVTLGGTNSNTEFPGWLDLERFSPSYRLLGAAKQNIKRSWNLLLREGSSSVFVTYLLAMVST